MPVRRLNHVQIAEDIVARIDAGEYKVGDKLPTYGELGRIYSVSHATIQRALALLRHSDVLDGYPGVGVFVKRRSSR